ncbi:MAG TPA: hypothetical protein VF916_04610 [Ktedonobacterales bacterium]
MSTQTAIEQGTSRPASSEPSARPIVLESQDLKDVAFIRTQYRETRNTTPEQIVSLALLTFGCALICWRALRQ